MDVLQQKDAADLLADYIPKCGQKPGGLPGFPVSDQFAQWSEGVAVGTEAWSVRLQSLDRGMIAMRRA